MVCLIILSKQPIFFLLCLCSQALSQNIQTIAGGGPHNIPAQQIEVPLPSGLAVDTAGNVYVSATLAGQIWKIDALGRVNVFAGTGASLLVGADPGDGLQAVDSAFSSVQGLVFDSLGNLYVADSNNRRVRKISPSGVVSTVAGNGGIGYSGDGGPATSAQFYSPTALAMDSANNLYILDAGHTTYFPYAITGQTIRRVTPAGVISTIAGNGSGVGSGDGGPATAAGLAGPVSIAVNSAGVLYIVESTNCRVRQVVNGIISIFAGAGTCADTGDGAPAISANLAYPTGVAVDRFNNVYIVEQSGVRIIAAGQSNIATFATGLSSEHSIAIDNSGANVYLGSFANFINKVSAGVTSLFVGNSTVASGAQNAFDLKLYSPTSLAVDNAGSLYFSETNQYRIRKLLLSAGSVTTAAGTGTFGNSADGAPITGPVANVTRLAFDLAGDYTFAEAGFSDGIHIRKVSGGVFSSLAVLPVISGGISASVVAANGDIYFANQSESQVHLFTQQTGVTSLYAGNGLYGTTGDGGLALNASLGYISSLAIDGAGNVFIGDGSTIRKVTQKTTIITTVATGISASSLFVDQSDNVFFIDGNRVRKVTAATNILSTVAGNGSGLFTGDGGLATLAGLSPVGITIDRAQNLFIGDNSGRIRTTKVSACFFTIGTPIVYLGRFGGTGSVTVSATNPDCPYSVSSSTGSVIITSAASGTGSGTVTFSVPADGGSDRVTNVAVGGATFTVSQAGTIGPQNVGFFQPSGGPLWVLDSNGTGIYEASDKTFAFAGQAGAIAVTGDWNGDGRTKVGYYLNGFWILDYNGNGVYDGTGPGGDKFYAFGGAGAAYIPIVGDWNGDGRTKIGFYNNGSWALDANGNGTFDGTGIGQDRFYGFGGNGVGEIPLLGDWNGDGRTKVGYFFKGSWMLDYDGNGSFSGVDKNYTTFPYSPGDKPVTGDWTGDGKAKIGIFRGGFWILDTNNNGTYDGIGTGQDKFFGFGGNVGEIPVVADWNGSGTSKIGIYVNGFWVLDFNGNGSYDGTGPGGDRFIAFGGSGAGYQPIIGRW